LEDLPELQQEVEFSARAATRLRTQYKLSINDAEEHFDEQRKQELDDTQEYNLLLLKCFSVQKAFYHEKLGRGHLSERTYRNLVYALNVEGDSLRYQGKLPRVPPRSRWGRWWRNSWMRLVQRLRIFDAYAESIRSHSTAQDYEYAWAGYHGCVRVLASIDDLSQQSHTDSSVVRELHVCFNRWAQGARKKLDAVAEQFPEFYEASQQRLAERMMLHNQRDFIVRQRRSGAIPNSVAASLLEEVDADIRMLRGYDTTQLKLDPGELLGKVPIFDDLPEQEVSRILACLKQRTVPARQDLIQQGDRDDSLYLIARGKVRVLRIEQGEEIEVAVLGAGDVVGEGGFLRGETCAATCRALTPCAIYELTRRDVDALQASFQGLLATLERGIMQRTADREK
jgi:CPA1 family monovalent cation:H+ antiporter